MLKVFAERRKKFKVYRIFTVIRKAVIAIKIGNKTNMLSPWLLLLFINVSSGDPCLYLRAKTNKQKNCL